MTEHLGTSYPGIGAAIAHNARRAADAEEARAISDSADREADRTRRSELYRQHGLCGEPFARTGACTEEPGHPPLGPEGSDWLHAESVGTEDELLAGGPPRTPLAKPRSRAGRQTVRKPCAECGGLRPVDVHGRFRFHDGPRTENGVVVPCLGSRRAPDEVSAAVAAARAAALAARTTPPSPQARLGIVVEHLDAMRTGRAPDPDPTAYLMLNSPVLAQRARDLLRALGL